MECDQLFPFQPHRGRPHDGQPQLPPLLHLHERQVQPQLPPLLHLYERQVQPQLPPLLHLHERQVERLNKLLFNQVS